MIISFNRYNGGGSGSGSTDLTNYWNSAVTQEHIESAASITYASGVSYTDQEVQSAYTILDEHITEVEEVTASAYTELHTGLMEVSGRTVDLSPYWNSAQTESAITLAVSGKADAKTLVDFDKTSQAERASIYADLKALYDGGSGATINKDYDFFKTVGTKQGLKIDYYTFSGNTLVFGKVVSPDNTSDQVVYGQVVVIDAAGNVDVVTNTVGGVDLSAYYTSAQTEQAITSKNYVTSADVKTQIEAYNYMDSTDAQVIATALVDLNTNKVAGSGIANIVKIEQTAYDTLVSQSATTSTTLYVVVPDSQ